MEQFAIADAIVYRGAKGKPDALFLLLTVCSPNVHSPMALCYRDLQQIPRDAFLLHVLLISHFPLSHDDAEGTSDIFVDGSLAFYALSTCVYCVCIDGRLYSYYVVVCRVCLCLTSSSSFSSPPNSRDPQSLRSIYTYLSYLLPISSLSLSLCGATIFSFSVDSSSYSFLDVVRAHTNASLLYLHC